MQVQPIGYLGYTLYRLGWHSAVHRHFHPVNRWLLSMFIYYRRGFDNYSDRVLFPLI